jgi:glycerol-1-phosphate dehydrogenase [NAD(P)+]
MKTIPSVEEFLQLDSRQLADTRLNCPYCGSIHSTPFGEIRTGLGAIEGVPAIAHRILGKQPIHPVVIFDKAIEPFIVANVLGTFKDAKLAFSLLPLGQVGIVLDSEDKIGDQATEGIDPSVDLLIGAGSGVICDLTKWIATRLRKPFMLCGTAPSMNGYTSITATITENGIKKSELLKPANAVVGDASVMAKAPIAMIRAGMEDLTARAICNADWKLSALLRQTDFCPLPYLMTEKPEKAYLAVAEGIGRADPDAIQVLTEAIMVSGLSMTILGDNTSPSSGGEHILSHFWDLLVHLRGVPKNLHGEQVGVGTIIMLALYEYMRKMDVGKIDPAAILRSRPSLEDIEAENRKLYGIQADDFNKVVIQKRIPDQEFVAYIKGIQGDWEKIWEALTPYIAPMEAIKKPLEAAGVSLTLDAIQRTPAEGIEALLNSSRYRPRYSLLDLAWELGIFPGEAELILEIAGVL